MSGKTDTLFSQRSPPTNAIGVILFCEAVGKVPAGNCRLASEETLNLQVAKVILIISQNKELADRLIYLHWCPVVEKIIPYNNQ